MIRLLLLFFYLVFFSTNLLAHVKHYNKIKFLKYDLYFNNELIGYHTFNFKKNDDLIQIIGKGKFKVSKMGIDLINYVTSSESIYRGNQLIKFTSKTNQNDKKKYVNVILLNNHLNIDGSSFKGKTKKETLLSSLWNHEIVTKKEQISAISGRINKQKVKFLGKKKIDIVGKSFETINFHIFSDDNKPMKEKKINIKIWYDINTLIWIKASYEKFGQWEYRLADIKY